MGGYPTGILPGEENVNGCYAQKPLKSCERIILASSEEGDTVIDFFCHSGTTLIAAEMLNRSCYTIDIDPVYCEIAIRRLERLRRTGKTGWQNGNPFEEELRLNEALKKLAGFENRVLEELERHRENLQERIKASQARAYC